MKKTVFKVLSIIMALCVFLGAMPVMSFAEKEEKQFYYAEKIEKIDFSPNAEIKSSFNASANKFYSTGAQVDTAKYFYNQLTSNQKKLYDQLWSAHQNSYSGCSVDGTTIILEFDMTGITIIGTGTSSTCGQNAINNAVDDILLAMSALYEDNPLYFGIGGISNAGCNGSKKYSSGSYTYTITALNIYLERDADHYSSIADIQIKREAVLEKMDTIKVNGISRHEKIKSIHDYLVNNIVYDTAISSPNIFDVYGAFINGFCVCEGYAEAFKMICDREGISCITVIGTGDGGAHKWNMVQMEDGEWYTLDATWNDQGSNIFYSYFLNGSGTKAPWFNPDVADSTVHIPTGEVFNGLTETLSYPTLSTDTYGIGLLGPNALDIQFDKTRGVIMVGKGISNYYRQFVDPDVYVLDTDFNTTRNGTGTTTSTLTVTDGTTTKTYLVAMRGDVDASNATNATDYNKITQTCATTYRVGDGTAKFYAGDMTQDGAIDGFDAIAHELYTSGTLVFD